MTIDRLMRFALVLVLAMSLLSACGGGGDDDADAADGGPAPDATVLVDQAAARMESLTTFAFDLSHESGRTPITLGLEMKSAEGEMVVPDRLRADIEAAVTQLGGAGVRVELVAADGQALMTNPFDRTEWVPVPGAAALDDLFNPHVGTVSALRASTNRQVVGEEEIDGIKTWKVMADLDGGDLEAFAPIAEPGYPVKTTLWIGADEPLVHRVRLEGKIGEEDIEGVVRVVELSRFDEPVTIELPDE